MPRVIVQARTSSERLPGKVLLPINGVPLAILCAKRLARDGLDVVVATSNDASDDPLAEAVVAAGLNCFRGSLCDVLGRFLDAVADMNDEEIVIRATADNPVPDAHFVRDLITFLETRDALYATTSSPADGLPYGLSAEAMKVGVLRESAQDSTDAWDREHVTPWLRRHHPPEVISRQYWGLEDYSALRCTIDTFDDYQRMHSAFSRLATDAVNAHWQQIIETLSRAPEAPRHRIPYRLASNMPQSLMTLGTVQLGLDYGINNRLGRPSEADAIKIVRHAIEHGVSSLDTARSYGESEQRIGRALNGSWKSRTKILTKIPALPDSLQGESVDLLRHWVDAQIYQSLFALNSRNLDVVMLHRWADRDFYDGAIWDRLLHHQSCGLIKSLGASIYHPHEASQALSEPAVKHIQLPFNILDRRWLEPEMQEHFRLRSDVSIYARSVFLQGLLLSEGHGRLRHDATNELSLKTIDSLVEQLRRSSRADLCIAYVRAHSWVTSLVIGVESLEQLQTNLDLFSATNPLRDEEVELVHEMLPGGANCLLDPSKWTA